jgi:ArsR family metal-binding transcriptional regulator
MIRAAISVLAIAAATVPVSGQSMSERLNDYPTEARADYVFGCMAANGQSRAVLSQCACSIDVIASILPYGKYVEAEAVLSLQQAGGEQMAMFKSAVVPRTMVADLRRAQAEAEILCF